MIDGELGLDWQSSVKTSSFTAAINKGYFVNTTSGSITVTMPSSPIMGNSIGIIDYAGTATSFNITVASSNNIQGSSNNRVINYTRGAIRITYSDSIQGWVVSAAANEGVDALPYTFNTDNFNTVLWSNGVGQHQSPITGVGFEPSFTWIKVRNAGTDHVLTDIMRGVTETLRTSTDAGYTTAPQGLTAFNNDGFSVGNDNRFNADERSMVAWNWRAPFANLAAEFNSNRQGQITLPSSITTPWNTSSEFGISCWINPSTWGSGQQTQAFSFNGPYSGNIGFDKEPSGNFRCFVTTSGGSFVGVNSSNNLSATNKWYHIVWTGSASAGVKLYVDGVNTGSASWDGTYLNNTGTNSIGLSPQSLRGNIAQFRVYSSYLTSSEVSDLYTEPAASNNTLNYPAGSGCIAAYPLQTDAVDLSGNYNGASSSVTFGKPGYLTQNTNGTAISTVAANPAAGFSIVQWNGTLSSAGNISVGHGLSAPPQIIISKNEGTNGTWVTRVPFLNNNAYDYLGLSETAILKQLNSSDGTMNVPTATTFDNNWNTSVGGSNGNPIIGYCFTSIAGYSKIGSYTWTAPSYTAGTMVTNLGFTPRFVLIKGTNVNSNWMLYDNKRVSGTQSYRLSPNISDEEDSIGYQGIIFDSDGFSAGVGADGYTTGSSGLNENGKTYIYLAIA